MNIVKKPISFIKKHKIWTGVIIIFLSLVIFALRPKSPIPPDTQTIAPGNLVQTVSVSGSVNADSIANLTFAIAGKLIYMGVKPGDMVKKYQTIAALDQRTLEDNLLNAKKALDSQQITFNNVNDFNGDRVITDTGLSTAAFRQLQQAMDTLDQSKIALDIQQIAKEQSVLVAPFDGILTSAASDVPGTNVSITDKYIVVDPSTLTFSMDVDEADVAKVAVGQTVNVVLDAYPNDTISLPVKKIDFVSHTTSNGGNAFTVKVYLPVNTKYSFKVGMNGNADIITAQKANVLTVPLSAIADGNIVYIKMAKGYRKQKITTGLENDIAAEVTNGLHTGDKIVLDPSKVSSKEIVQ